MREFYEKVYFAELERKSKIDAGVTIPIGIGAFGVALIKSAVDGMPDSGVVRAVSLGLISVAILSFVSLLFFLSKFLERNSYKTTPFMDDYAKHYADLKEFESKPGVTESADDLFERNLVDSFIACATKNAKANKVRSDALHFANISAFVLVMFALLSSALILLAEKI